MLSWIEATWAVPSHVKAITTLRTSGVSKQPYHYANLGLHVGDDDVAVMSNRAALIEALSLKHDPVWLDQTHSTVVMRADEAINQTLKADACVTWTDDLPLTVMTADCLPIVMTDKIGSVVAAVHAGWKGLLHGVIENAIQAMDMAPHQLIAWIGPSISQHAYEVGADFLDNFAGFTAKWEQCFKPSQTKDRFLCSLPRLASYWMQERGIKVYISGCCTYSDDRFYSYRRSQVTGRMATIVWKSSES